MSQEYMETAIKIANNPNIKCPIQSFPKDHTIKISSRMLEAIIMQAIMQTNPHCSALAIKGAVNWAMMHAEAETPHEERMIEIGMRTNQS